MGRRRKLLGGPSYSATERGIINVPRGSVQALTRPGWLLGPVSGRAAVDILEGEPDPIGARCFEIHAAERLRVLDPEGH